MAGHCCRGSRYPRLTLPCACRVPREPRGSHQQIRQVLACSHSDCSALWTDAQSWTLCGPCRGYLLTAASTVHFLTRIVARLGWSCLLRCVSDLRVWPLQWATFGTNASFIDSADVRVGLARGGPSDNLGAGLSEHASKPTLCAEAEEEEGESEREEEDIFALEGETEHLHLSTPGQPQEQPSQERMQGRGGWEGAASGANKTC